MIRRETGRDMIEPVCVRGTAVQAQHGPASRGAVIQIVKPDAVDFGMMAGAFGGDEFVHCVRVGLNSGGRILREIVAGL